MKNKYYFIFLLLFITVISITCTFAEDINSTSVGTTNNEQSDDLERQINNLKTYLDSKYSDYEILTDIGSGINYTKPGLKKLIEKKV